MAKELVEFLVVGGELEVVWHDPLAIPIPSPLLSPQCLGTQEAGQTLDWIKGMTPPWEWQLWICRGNPWVSRPQPLPLPEVTLTPTPWVWACGSMGS